MICDVTYRCCWCERFQSEKCKQSFALLGISKRWPIDGIQSLPWQALFFTRYLFFLLFFVLLGFPMIFLWVVEFQNSVVLHSLSQEANLKLCLFAPCHRLTYCNTFQRPPLVYWNGTAIVIAVVTICQNKVVGRCGLSGCKFFGHAFYQYWNHFDSFSTLIDSPPPAMPS